MVPAPFGPGAIDGDSMPHTLRHFSCRINLRDGRAARNRPSHPANQPFALRSSCSSLAI
jgi:hypothetical protein